MKLLLIFSDLYLTTGGGQTVYRKIIEATPEIEFYYFCEQESSNALRPKNAKAINLLGYCDLKVISELPFSNFQKKELKRADNFARSVAGMHFDIVELPDFYYLGNLLRVAFAHHNVTVNRYILAMHGNNSKSKSTNWGSTGENAPEQKILEREQFECADAVYSISPQYMAEWQSVFMREIHYVNPIHFVNIPTHLTLPKSDNNSPHIYCIGRSERRKGNDLFIELVRWINKDLYGKAVQIGEHVLSKEGVTSNYILKNIAALRNVELETLPSLNRQQLLQLFSERSLVILPVRYDTLNLVAIEAIFAGCPVAISSKAGVCAYLDQEFPELPYIKIDFENFYGSVSKIEDLLRNYDSYRENLLDCLRKVECKLSVKLDMVSLYSSILQSPPKTLPVIGILYEKRVASPLTKIENIGRKFMPKSYYIDSKHKITIACRNILRKLRYSRLYYLYSLLDSANVSSRLKCLSPNSLETKASKKAIYKKLHKIYANSTSSLYRCNFWLEIANTERLLENEVMAVTYELRTLRLVGRDAFDILPRILQTLNNKNLPTIAEALQKLYGDTENAEQNVYNYLKETYKKNLTKPELELEKIDDRRSDSPTRVSIIVSMYNAAPKLKFFLTALMQQEMIKRGEVEIILVDSGSPDIEYEVLKEFWNTNSINSIYVRSGNRETIQAAWNRGIKIAKSPYLVFLGVDETIYPDALDILAGELDVNNSIDWAMGNSLVTDVEPSGLYKNDVMSYIRNNATKDHVYLETCYLSWVGGMYRKSIHDRFGYYDESFSAAGDTEFKSRILSHINVKFIPKTLGLFLNYPDERTTQSPKAEIEDFRAWYIFRTAGGVRYTLENRSIEEAEALLCNALGYRKSYRKHISSDIEYACYISEFLMKQSSKAPWLEELALDLRNMLTSLQELEFTFTSTNRFNCLKQIVKCAYLFAIKQTRHTKLLAGKAQPTYQIFNDNRYEQHSWLWKSNG